MRNPLTPSPSGRGLGVRVEKTQVVIVQNINPGWKSRATSSMNFHPVPTEGQITTTFPTLIETVDEGFDFGL